MTTLNPARPPRARHRAEQESTAMPKITTETDARWSVDCNAFPEDVDTTDPVAVAQHALTTIRRWVETGYQPVIDVTLPDGTEHAIDLELEEHQRREAEGPEYGERGECTKCRTEVEFVGVEPSAKEAELGIDTGHGWWDRGGNYSCPAGGTHESNGSGR